jgi:hypothetical protein
VPAPLRQQAHATRDSTRKTAWKASTTVARCSAVHLTRVRHASFPLSVFFLLLRAVPCLRRLKRLAGLSPGPLSTCLASFGRAHNGAHDSHDRMDSAVLAGCLRFVPEVTVDCSRSEGTAGQQRRHKEVSSQAPMRRAQKQSAAGRRKRRQGIAFRRHVNATRYLLGPCSRGCISISQCARAFVVSNSHPRFLNHLQFSAHGGQES